MATHWQRGGVYFGNPWANQHFLAQSIPAGGTLLRVHYGISAEAFVTVNAGDNQLTLASYMANGLCFGMVTVVGDGTEVPPNAYLAQNDQLPPTQRWVHHATAYPVVQSWAPFAGQTYAFGLPESWTNISTKGQVKATGIPPGDNLDLFLSVGGINGVWSTLGGTDLAMGWAWWSVLWQD